MASSVSDTVSALQGGVQSIPPQTAVSNIEGWQQELRDLGPAGAGIVADLDSLKSELGSSQPDGAKLQSLLSSLGQATTAAAAQAPESARDDLRQLGSALSSIG